MSTTPAEGFEPFSASELAALEALEVGATDPPWWFDEDERTWRLHGTWGWTPAQHSIPAQPINKQILKAPKRNTPYAEYWPNRQDAELIVGLRNALPRIVHELKRLYPLTARCLCQEGASPSCPVHGAVQALQRCTEELEALRERLKMLEGWLERRPQVSLPEPGVPYCAEHQAWHVGRCKED